MLLLPVFFVVLVWYMIICYKWKKNIFNALEKIPGQKWYPIFGSSYTYVGTTRENVLNKFVDVVNTYRPFFKAWNGNIAEIHVMKPDHLQIILKNSTHTPKGPFYQYIFPWLGEGLFISEGAKWFMQRKLLTPSFHFKILDGFVKSFASQSEPLIEKLESRAAEGKFFNIVPDLACCTLGIICETAMGVPLKAITDKPLEYVQNVYDITEMAMWRYWRPYVTEPIFQLHPKGRKFRRLVKDLHAFSSKVVDYRKRRANNSSQIGAEKPRQSFMDVVLDSENDNAMSDSDLKALVDTFLVAGYETTSNTVSWALFLLGNHPELQEKVYQEVKRVLKDKASPTTMEELNELKYTECAARETLRLYPVLPFITRRLTTDVDIDGYKVPAGTQAIMHIFQVHRDAEHFPEPNKFDPDRFLPENAKNRHPFAYIPFSAGPRNCLGMRFAILELKALLATIIKRFKVTALDTPEELNLFAHVVLRSQTGINVKLEIRDE